MECGEQASVHYTDILAQRQVDKLSSRIMLNWFVGMLMKRCIKYLPS